MNALFNFYTSPYDGDFHPQDFFRTNITIFISNIETKLTKSPKDLSKLVDLIVNNFKAYDQAGEIFLTNLKVLGLNEEDYTVYPDEPDYWQADYHLEQFQPTLLFLVDTREQTLKLAYLPSPEIYFLEPNLLLQEGDHIDIRTLFANLETPENALSIYYQQSNQTLSEEEYDQLADKLAVYDASSEISQETVEKLDDAYTVILADIAKKSTEFQNQDLTNIEKAFLQTHSFDEIIKNSDQFCQRILKNYAILNNYLATFGKYYEFCLDEDKFSELIEQDYDPDTDPDFS